MYSNGKKQGDGLLARDVPASPTENGFFF